jgi:PAS domain S-box-containing protein
MSHRLEVGGPARLWRPVEASLAVALLLVGLLSLFFWRMTQERAEEAERLAHSREVFTSLELTLKHLLDAETGARGFAVTGNEPFLEPYESSKRATNLDLETLSKLTVGQTQERQLGAVAEQAHRVLEAAGGLAAARQTSGISPAVAQLTLGEQSMDAARLTIQEMETEEKQLLEQHTQRARGSRYFTRFALWMSGILGFILLSISGITGLRAIRRAARTEFRVKALNTELEGRAEQHTTALEAEAGARQKTQSKLRASEEMFRVLLDGINDYAVYMLDRTGRVISWNAGAAQITGYRAEEVMGKHIRRFYLATDEEQARSQESLNEAASAGRFEGEGWRVRKDGSTFWANSVITPLYRTNGSLRGYSKVVRDITARKQEVEKRERLAAVVDSSEDAIISRTLEGTITAWNRGAEHVFGYLAAEAVGKSILMLVPEERKAEEFEILARIGNGESVQHFETVRVRKGGERISVSVTISPIRNRDGVVIGASKIARDISERKRAADQLAAQASELGRSGQALEAQKLLLQSVLNSMVEGLIAADENGKLILCNPAAEKILGLCGADFSPGDWAARYGAFLPDMITPFPNEQNPLLRAIGGEISSAEIFFRNPGLDLGAWIESNGAPLRDKEGQVRGGVIAFRDITRRKANELEIRELNQDLEARITERTAQLETANHEVGAFSYSVSHDLRAPLRHISGFARILLADFGEGMEPEARGHLQLIEEAVVRMGLLVDGLLSLATLGRQALQLRRTELNTIVEEVVSILQPECEGRLVEWQIAPLPALECDPILIGQVFQNLLSNAIKYSRGRSSGFIEVGSIQEPGEPAVIFVRDNGAGFNMKYAEKLFGVFQRMHTEAEFEGTGVGLATVRRIIQKHGGTVWAEAEPDRGATFYFTLSGKEQVFEARNATSTSSGR